MFYFYHIKDILKRAKTLANCDVKMNNTIAQRVTTLQQEKSK